MTVDFKQLVNAVKSAVASDEHVFVGYSGGLDSSVLLQAAQQAIPSERLTAVHCDHGISLRSAQWAEHCMLESESLGISCIKHELNLGAYASEQSARAARYKAFDKSMMTKNSPLLLLGHHADDQIETLLFRLIRGSGLKGLAGIPTVRALQFGRLVRPLLQFSKADLTRIALSRQISWIEDESNSDNKFDRNFIRNQVLPNIEQRWSNARTNLAQTQATLIESELLLNQYADSLLERLDRRNEPFGESVSLKFLVELTDEKQNLVLRRLAALKSTYQLSTRHLDQIKTQLFESREDASPLFEFNEIQFRRYKTRLYLLCSIPNDSVDLSIIKWDGRATLAIAKFGTLNLLKGQPDDFEVRFRQQGDSGLKVKPVDRAHSQSLKKIMQEYEICPWLRELTPIIYLRGQIISIGQEIQCSEYQFQWSWKE